MGFDQPPDASRARIIEAVEDSLRRLRGDCIDFYQIHTPNPKTPVEETLRALDDIVRQGKVRAIGCSNFGPALAAESAAVAGADKLTPS